MKYSFILLYVITTIVNSCNSDIKEQASKDDKKKETPKLFEYYNLFTLEGIGEIKQPNNKFPYVSIKSIDDSVLISHYLDSNRIYTSSYVKDDSFFLRRYKLNLGKDNLFIKEYTRAKDIITITYFPGPKGIYEVAWRISVFSDSSIKVYDFSQNIEGDIDLYTALSFINTRKIRIISTTSYSTKGSNIEILDQYKNLEHKTFHKDKYSASSFGKPLHWWLIYVGHSYSKSLEFSSYKLNNPTWKHNFER